MDDCFIFIKGQAPGTWDRRFAFLAAESFSREVMKRQSNYLISTNSSFEVFVHRSTTIRVPKVCRPSLELANLEQRTFCHHHSRHKFTHAFTHSFRNTYMPRFVVHLLASFPTPYAASWQGSWTWRRIFTTWASFPVQSRKPPSLLSAPSWLPLSW